MVTVEHETVKLVNKILSWIGFKQVFDFMLNSIFPADNFCSFRQQFGGYYLPALYNSCVKKMSQTKINSETLSKFKPLKCRIMSFRTINSPKTFYKANKSIPQSF